MSARFAEKVIIITGATSGIGRAAAERIAREGAKLVLAARGREAGIALETEIRTAGGEATFVPADVTVESEVAKLIWQAVNRYGRLDGAFNNVGAPTALGPVTEIGAKAWHAELGLNLSSVFFGLKHQIPAIWASGGGAILNNASTCAVGGYPDTPAYCAAKHGVLGLTRSAAVDMAEAGIRINALLTGGVDTPLTRWLATANPRLTPEESWRAQVGMQPLGRMAEPEEVAAFVAFLLSDDSTFITGAALPIDGGMTARL